MGQRRPKAPKAAARLPAKKASRQNATAMYHPSPVSRSSNARNLITAGRRLADQCAERTDGQRVKEPDTWRRERARNAKTRRAKTAASANGLTAHQCPVLRQEITKKWAFLHYSCTIPSTSHHSIPYQSMRGRMCDMAVPAKSQRARQRRSTG